MTQPTRSADGARGDSGRTPRFTPKLFTVLGEGYGLDALRADAFAGLTVAIVALPLSMAIAVASGATPAQGLWTAIVGGLVVSALGGSRFQIGGPAGAFIVLVAASMLEHGPAGTALAVGLSGVILAAAGLLRLGDYVKYIPYPVTVGFTTGIALIIAASQASAFLGLQLESEPAALPQKLAALAGALDGVSPAAAALGLATAATILAFKRWRPLWPGMLIGVAGASLAAALAGLPVETLGTRFGGVPAGLPHPPRLDLSPQAVLAVLPTAAAFAMLGAIESLLSAVVADGMTGRRHRSNAELTAQGAANIASGLIGGIPVTGTIARTATNVRAGAHGPVAGMLHAVFLLAFVLLAAPLAAYIPLAALAGVLLVVAWNMIERHAIAAIAQGSAEDTAVFLTTLLLTLFRDLGEAIVVGTALGAVLFVRRMSRASGVRAVTPGGRGEDASHPEMDASSDIAVFRLSGAFFFGSAATIASILERVGADRTHLVLDLSGAMFVDATGARAVLALVEKARRRGAAVTIAGAGPEARRVLRAHGVAEACVAYADDVDAALDALRTSEPPAA
ncbi:sodium-independent anion transporter [Marinicauda salina]|uniref:Sodium-independent anion transporter n=1 Tax=Marinicauda salina TaxID=2135793 RepID=A0A2U2BSJ0_9PROT|nr:SulP family inorganic anion transporter [Marinicauda salina]PWE16960.1 sodium-independent anion transporter [Marinicauda salina]